MKLKFDGQENYAAIRFNSQDLARDYCQTQKHGFALDFWCVDTFDSKAAAKPAWEKAKTIATAKK